MFGPADFNFVVFEGHAVQQEHVVGLFHTAKVHHDEGVVFGLPHLEQRVAWPGEKA